MENRKRPVLDRHEETKSTTFVSKLNFAFLEMIHKKRSKLNTKMAKRHYRGSSGDDTLKDIGISQ
ncbi:hypothetical protein L484_002427 [Morus notabilis]|uniref:Uncharacterized protein n=1 Tax=Morus notabilis TaxID=981085 RepID=W9QBC8_9ROSA|nr:hypothetical protein L484_002427 [Morus notabilis]